MSELAFDSQGQAIDLPDEATAWQVRRVASRGLPQLMYLADGLPLFLPITAGIADLHTAVEMPGLYVLCTVDDQRRPIAGLPTAYVLLEPPPAFGDARLRGLAPAGADAQLDELAGWRGPAKRSPSSSSRTTRCYRTPPKRCSASPRMPTRPSRRFAIL